MDGDVCRHQKHGCCLDVWTLRCALLDGQTSRGPHKVSLIRSALEVRSMQIAAFPACHRMAVSLCACIWTSSTMSLIFFEDEGRYLLGTEPDIWLGVLRAVLGETFLNYGLHDEEHVAP